MGKTLQKLLVICGPTATGKTKLAFDLAKKFNGALISADSRQVYKHMRIGTGRGEENILGYDLVNPNEEFSVSQYVEFADNAIKKIIQVKKLPILVGGTGFYVKAIVDGIKSINIPPDKKLRSTFANIPANELFKILEKLNHQKALSMNDSDKNNPRRLVRAIEIANSILRYKDTEILEQTSKYKVLMVGLTAPNEELKERIGKRVDERIRVGFGTEIIFLKENGYWDGVPSKTLGYKDWPDVRKWKLEEFKYAKRQTTWFKKDKRINWFDVDKAGFEKNVENIVQKWYSDGNAEKN